MRSTCDTVIALDDLFNSTMLYILEVSFSQEATAAATYAASSIENNFMAALEVMVNELTETQKLLPKLS